MRNHRSAVYLCASGFLDIFLASITTGVSYALHLHQPPYMTFALDEKYGWLNRRAFKQHIENSYEKERFIRIDSNLNAVERTKITLVGAVRQMAYKRATHRLVCSETARNQWRETWGLETKVASGALSEEAFVASKAHLNIKLPDHGDKVFCVARHDPNKRIDVLIKGFALVLEQRPDALLVIAGTGPQHEELKGLAASLGIGGRVVFAGLVPEDDLNSLYQWSEVFVAIDFADYRLTAFEALARDCKVVVSVEADCEESLRASGYMYFARPDPVGVAEQLVASMSGQPTISLSALQDILRGYLWENYCRTLEEILVGSGEDHYGNPDASGSGRPVV
jgi:glycosyltransferase involved in cell wall biosynthesis